MGKKAGTFWPPGAKKTPRRGKPGVRGASGDLLGQVLRPGITTVDIPCPSPYDVGHQRAQCDKAGAPMRLCLHCEKPLTSRKARIFCSHSCQMRHRHATKDLAGSHNPRWKGGLKHDPRGYIRVLMPGHPRADKTGYVFQHILVAEEHLGRPISPRARVHHLNHNRSDNRPENLLVYGSNREHMEYHSGEYPSFKGKHCSPEMKAAIGAANRGHRDSPETRGRRGAASRRAWADPDTRARRLRTHYSQVGKRDSSGRFMRPQAGV